jgi:hypothetical protein
MEISTNGQIATGKYSSKAKLLEPAHIFEEEEIQKKKSNL